MLTGQLYRSVALDRVSDDDLAMITDLGIRTVFDLRTTMERERSPDRLPAGADHVPLDVLADSGEADPAAIFALMQDPPRASRELAGGGTEAFYLAAYRDFVRLGSARAGFAQLFRRLAQEQGVPALVHCTTGKDRTGWVVAVLLLFLGVRVEVVMHDYLISDAEVRSAYRSVMEDFIAHGGSRDVIEPLMSVQPSFLDAAIEVMHAEFGSVERYFSEGLRLETATLDALRTRFLERA